MYIQLLCRLPLLQHADALLILSACELFLFSHYARNILLFSLESSSIPPLLISKSTSKLQYCRERVLKNFSFEIFHTIESDKKFSKNCLRLSDSLFLFFSHLYFSHSSSLIYLNYSCRIKSKNWHHAFSRRSIY